MSLHDIFRLELTRREIEALDRQIRNSNPHRNFDPEAVDFVKDKVQRCIERGPLQKA